jgi:hypothetical protein
LYDVWQVRKLSGAGQFKACIGTICAEALNTGMLQALAGAKQVHVFDRRADETIGWIQEKDATLSAQSYGQDLETIQALIRQHQVFETDLAAVKEQV